MKKNIITTIFILALGMGSFINQASAQGHAQGQLGVSATVGYNLTSLIARLVSLNSDAVGSVPPITGAVDYGISDRFSLGLAVTHQSIGLSVGDSLSGSSEQFEGNLSCTNIGIRPLFHFGGSDDLDFYAGVRVGTTLWTAKSESNNPDFDPVEEITRGGGRRINLQPVVGIAYYFGNGPLALNAEAATGPYLVAIGAKLRL